MTQIWIARHDAPATALGAEGGGVEFLAVEEFDGVAEVHGEGLSGWVEGAHVVALAVGFDLGLRGEIARGGEGGELGGHFGGGGQGHGPEAGGFGGVPCGFAIDDLLRGSGHGVVGGEIGHGAGGDIAAVVAAGAAAEVAAGDAEIEHLVEVGDKHGEPGGLLGEVGGERGLAGLGDVHVAGFLDEAALERGRRGGEVELGELLGRGRHGEMRFGLSPGARLPYTTRVRLLLGGFILFLLSCLPLRGDEVLRQVQRELRARKYYFGPVDGGRSPESEKALEEFQRAKGLDAHGEADEETLRALGLRPPTEVVSAESQALQLGREWLARYWRACESGDWAAEERCYAERVRYYYEGEVTRDFLRQQRMKYCALWPVRRQTALVSYASWNPRRHDELWVSARVRNEVRGGEGPRRVFTEDLLFILRQAGGEWRLVEVREWPLAPLKGLP